jgi:3-methyl-2-oxobutanoate hydroxymethyltransferase
MADQTPRKTRVSHIRAMKADGRRVTVATAYDAITAEWCEAAELDIVLVGDSMTRMVLGRDREIRLTLDEMLHHCRAVAAGSHRPLLVGDMPFMTTRISPEKALSNAARMVQEGRVEAVKMEGGQEMAPTVARLVQAGIPVMGHVGLLPQSFHATGGYRVQGRDEDAARVLADARAIEQAGAFCVVLELIPAGLAREISEALTIPTIGIGAGPHCDGQVLVMSDLVGLTPGDPPKLARTYVDLRGQAIKALAEYAAEVRDGDFPGPEQTIND